VFIADFMSEHDQGREMDRGQRCNRNPASAKKEGDRKQVSEARTKYHADAAFS
jgi:hypothetical protein